MHFLVQLPAILLSVFGNDEREGIQENQVMKKFAFVFASTSIALIHPISASAAPAPRISMAKAKQIALKLAPGRIISSEFENEGGAWRYSFDIQQKGNVQEIGIDGRSGKVVENRSEGKVDHD